MGEYKILIADDEAPQRETLGGFLKKQGYDVVLAENGEKAVTVVESEVIDLVITDLRMPGRDGLGVLQEVRKLNPEIAVIVLTAYGTVESAVQAMQDGAYTYLTKPIDLASLKLQIERALERKILLEENRELKIRLGDTPVSGIIAGSQEMREVLGLVARAAPTRASVLILGETGTGKELIARAIHESSGRQEHPFIPVNIAAIPETLVESELFGHEKGSFTGAYAHHKGFFERAEGGTLFIDEIGDMPVAAQLKLLRVLQDGTINRVGGNQEIKVNVRIVAATHKDLQVAMKSGKFREDLFYRLNVVRINVPPLRQRKSDIPALVEHFVQRFSELNGKPVEGMSREALDTLMKYQWQGNVRELENVVESAVVMTRGTVISERELPPEVRQEINPAIDSSDVLYDSSLPLGERLENFEKSVILAALDENGGNRSETARQLGMSEKNIRDRLKRWEV
ncbi:sigma-54 dependent transcriptional regulator [bacterium]|nr:sigma-54 dependent transcriptional regulator [bacterium]